MKRPLVFYLTDIPVNNEIDDLKIAYIDYLGYWEENNYLSGKSVRIPLELQYHLHIMGEITDHIFEIVNPKINENDFINAGFVKDQSFIDFIQKYETLN